MTEDETSPSEDALESAPDSTTATPTEAAPAFDFSGMRGFQTLAAAPADESEAYREELVKELVARAERFVQSVDGALVLASDGVIRWLGDPVGRLVAGDAVLNPRAVLLADEALPQENREAAERRLSLWITAHIQKVLGPLQALATPEGAPTGLTEVADKIVEALGVLNRDDVRKQVKALDQNARAGLRKLGVRFGANYIFLPALLKPGARALCLQLWGLKHGAEPDADRLVAYAAAGRTSFPVDGAPSPNAYRIAGFRLCGERVVRVDIVERLTDLIRAAIPDLMRGSGSGAPAAAGFVVTQQMTSLTGCAGEAFASILRSLGYESHQVKKSEHDATRRRPEPVRLETPAEAPAEEAPNSSPAEGEEATGSENEAAPVDAEVSATVEAEPESAPELEAEPEPVVEAAASEPENAAPVVAEAETPAQDVAAASASEPESAEPESAEPVAAETESSAEAVDDDAAEAEAAEPAPEEDPVIEIWRPAPRRHQHGGGGRRQPSNPWSSLPPEGTGKIIWRAKEPKPAPPPRRDPPERAPDYVAAPAPSAETVEMAEPAVVDSAPQEPSHRHSHRQQPGRGDRRDQPFKGPKRDERRYDRPQGDRPPRKEPRPAVVDPDSPFAKLAALRPLLERRDKRS